MTSDKLPLKEKPTHDHLRIFLVIFTCIVYAVVITFNYLSSSEIARGTLYLNSTGDISDKYYIEIVPSGWTFGLIWGTIYVYNSQGLIYGLTTLCRRRGSDGRYVYQDGTCTPPLMYISIIVNLVSNISWIFLWDRQYVGICLLPIVLATFSLYVAIFFTAKATYDNRGVCCYEIWHVRAHVHNSLAFYATWLSIATLINFAIVLAYKGADVPQTKASTMVLSVLSVEIIAWFALDLSVLDRYVRYIVTPYIVVILALIGSITKNWNAVNPNSIFTAVLLAVVCVLFLVKIGVMVWRHRKKPIVPESKA